MIVQEVISQFGLSANDFAIAKITDGYINQTYKLEGAQHYVLQRINTNVFTHPDVIASNLKIASDFLKENYPDYLFLSSLATADGKQMAYDTENYPWRLFPYITNTITINKVDTEKEAFNAAAGFALLCKNLSTCDVSLFKPTIDKFHDLTWRYEQFEEALRNTNAERLARAHNAIEKCIEYNYLVKEYIQNISSGVLKLRVVHNDTKINNILFDKDSREAVCVIDLDTLMPGYFIYDVGDMIRTFVSPVAEEEKDISKISFRKNIYDALVEGYLSQMDKSLSDREKELIPFAGMMMTYIMALRMLTDFLNGDIYYQIIYPEQNINRATNQLKLMDVLKENIF